jgi:hypothetical protein
VIAKTDEMNDMCTEINGRWANITTNLSDVKTGLDNIKLELNNIIHVPSDPFAVVLTIETLDNMDGLEQLVQQVNQLLSSVLITLPTFDLVRLGTLLSDMQNLLTITLNKLNSVGFFLPTGVLSHISTITGKLTSAISALDKTPGIPSNNWSDYGIKQLTSKLCGDVGDIRGLLKVNEKLKLGLPIQPYTPTIKEISIDYNATADMQDMVFAHLYPYGQTSKTEDINNKPTLLPYFQDEGTLFIGLKNLRTGGAVHLLFQLAEATANTEIDRAIIEWHYLSNNNWLPLRKGFEITDDKTDELSTSGIVSISVPSDITEKGHTIMPEDTFWIRVSASKNVAAICETIGIHTQAVRATFTILPPNDLTRLSEPLADGLLSKLSEADANVKQVSQPYESFGGTPPEVDDLFYVRASERLRHKGRAINVFDYERLTLQMFPQIFKAKCIPHTMALGAHNYKNDVEWAAGFVTIVVVPDLKRLKTGENLYPRAPLSMLDEIRDYLCQRTSPFVRLRIMNPRYEGMNVRIQVQFNKGYDENYYRSQLRTDIIHFLAPWWMGDTEKLRFGQPLYYSDLVRFVEGQEYIDYITCLEFWHEEDTKGTYKVVDPKTARSILAPGTIIVCQPEAPDCPEFDGKNIPDCIKPCTPASDRIPNLDEKITC